jgi:hypothetical protein
VENVPTDFIVIAGRAIGSRVLWRETGQTDVQPLPEMQARIRDWLDDDVARLCPSLEGSMRRLMGDSLSRAGAQPGNLFL